MGQLTNQYVSQSYQGLLKLDDSTTGVTGTLQYVTDGLGNKIPMLASTSSIVISGSFYGDGSNLTGLTIDSSSFVDSGSFNAFTSSMNNFTSSINNFTSSIDLRVDALELETGSLQLQINQKLDTGSFNAYTSSNDSKVDALIAATSSYASTASLDTLSGSIAVTDLSQNNRLDSIETETGSLQLQINSKLDTGSFDTFTASYYVDSGSFDTRIEGIIAGTGAYVSTLDFNAYTSSQAGTDLAQDNRLDSLELATGSYATTGSNTFTGIQQINNDVIIQGNLYVSGAEVIVSSSTLIVGDREIELNANRTVGNAGIIVYDVIAPEGTGSLQWDATNDFWMAGQYGSESRIILSSDTGSMSVATSSYSDYAVSSSQAQNAVSSSYSDFAVSSSLAQNAISSSHSVNADTAISSSFATNSDTAVSSSYAQNSDIAVSSSYSDYAVTASFALNAPVIDTGSFATTGSNVFIGNQTITGSVVVTGSFELNGMTYPETDGLEYQFIQTDGAGNLLWEDVHSVFEHVIAGENLSKTDPVYLSGSQGATPIAYKSDAGIPATMPAVYIVNENIASGSQGRVIANGLIEGIDLTGFVAGELAYLGVGGGWTTTRPTGSAEVQVLGVITKGGSGGKGYVWNSGRNRNPNIETNHVWMGDNDFYPQAVSTSSLIVDTSISSSYSDFAVTASFALSGGGGSIDTGSFATTGSNTFFGDQTIETGSLLLAGSAANQTTIGVDFIEDPNLNGGNLYLPRVDANNIPMYVSSSHNIIMTDSNATSAGNYTYLIPSNSLWDGRNIVGTPVRFTTTGGQIPDSIRMIGNYFNGYSTNNITLTYSTSSVANNVSMDSNVVAGSVNMNTPQSYRNYSMYNNIVGGTLNVYQNLAASYNTVQTYSPIVGYNNINGFINLNAQSGSFGAVNYNNVNGSINVYNHVTPNASSQRLDVEYNNLGGISQYIYLGKNTATNTTTEFNSNIMQGYGNYVRPYDVNSDSGSVYNSLIVGAGLIVSASHRDGASSTSAFAALGTYNEGGILANTEAYQLVVGTGKSNATRKTAFAISGSGVVENRAGARVYGGNLDVSGSAITTNDIIHFSGYSGGGANNYQTMGLDTANRILIRNYNNNASANVYVDVDNNASSSQVQFFSVVPGVSTVGSFNYVHTANDGVRLDSNAAKNVNFPNAVLDISGITSSDQITFDYGSGVYTTVGLEGSETMLLRNFGGNANSNLRLISDNTNSIGTFRLNVGGGGTAGNLSYDVFSTGQKIFASDGTMIYFPNATTIIDSLNVYHDAQITGSLSGSNAEFSGNLDVAGNAEVSGLTTNADALIGGSTGTLTSKRLHFIGNPFNTNVGDNLGALRYDGNNTQFSLTNYLLANNTTGSYLEMVTDTGNTNTQVTIRANYNNSETNIIVQNYNGYNGVTVNSDDFFVNSLTYLNANTVISGSLKGEVNPISIASNTGSVNFSEGNFFTMNPSATFHIQGQNIAPGQTINVLVAPTGSISATFESNIKQPSGSAYTPTDGGLDILTLVSFDNSTVYLANVQNLI